MLQPYQQSVPLQSQEGCYYCENTRGTAPDEIQSSNKDIFDIHLPLRSRNSTIAADYILAPMCPAGYSDVSGSFAHGGRAISTK